MTKRVELYFKSEDDVESVQANLNTLKVNNLTIEEMTDDTDTKMFAPFLPTNVSSTGINNGAAFGFPSPFTSIIANNNDDDHFANDRITHLLRVDVEEEDFEQFLNIIKNYDCYVAK